MEKLAVELGFVVIGRNEGERLRSCLQSILALSHAIVYADSASSDGSPDVAGKLGVTVVRLPNDGRLTAARGRNAGYQKLRAVAPECKFVQFLDGDCVIQPMWIEEALGFLREHSDVAVVCGRRFEAHPEASLYNALCDLEWNTPIGQTQECGGDALVRCEAFDQVGGYRSHLQAGEEPEMTARMSAAGWKIWRLDTPMAEHDAKIYSLRQWWQRTQRGGYGYAQVWFSTKNLSHRLYGRQLFSALGWAALLPLIVIVSSVIVGRPILLCLLPLLYGLQVLRIAMRSAHHRMWMRATLLVLAKFPEAIGAFRFLVARDAGRVAEYKR